MLMNMKELLKVADEKGFAVPAFNIGSDQLLKAVMQQVKEMKSPVILEMSPDEFNFVENSLIQSMIYEASKTDVPVVIHLDHGDKYETVVRAIQAGFTSVMIDASKLPYEENIAITQKVCEVAHLANLPVMDHFSIKCSLLLLVQILLLHDRFVHQYIILHQLLLKWSEILRSSFLFQPRSQFLQVLQGSHHFLTAQKYL